MKNYSKKLLLVNTFGTLGYFSCIFSWAWVALLYLPMILENKYVVDFLIPVPSEQIPAEPIITTSSPMMIIFAVIVTIVVIIATIIVLIKIPVAVAKTGKSVTTKAANTAVPLITKGHSLPNSQKKRLTVNLIKLVKLLLVLLPVGATLMGVFIELPVPYDVTILVSSILALLTLLWFSLQYIFARLLHLDLNKLV